MKIRKYILSLVAAAGCAVCVAAIADGRNDDKQEKVKPAENMPAKVDTQRSPYSLINLAGSEDGIPYGLRLMGVNDREVSLSWNTPEPTDGYWDDSTRPAVSAGSISTPTTRRRTRGRPAPSPIWDRRWPSS